jgi:hypothetical protein
MRAISRSGAGQERLREGAEVATAGRNASPRHDCMSESAQSDSEAFQESG